VTIATRPVREFSTMLRTSGWLVGLWMVVGWLGCESSQTEYRQFSADEDTRPESAGDVPLNPAVAETTQSAAVSDTSAGASTPTEATDPTNTVLPTTSAAEATAANPATAASADRPPRVPLPRRIADLQADGSVAASESTFFNVSAEATISEPRAIELLVSEKEFPRVAPDGVLRVTYDDFDLLKVLNMDPVPPDAVDYFPSWLKGLDGARVRVKGFMYPPARSSGLPTFVLARDNQICCFGRDPKVYDIIPVMLAEGVTTDYIPNRPFDVVGRFAIRPDVFRGKLENLYEIEDAVIIPQ
jgi:hypothetical protein